MPRGVSQSLGATNSATSPASSSFLRTCFVFRSTPSKPRSRYIFSFRLKLKLVRTGGPKGSAPSWMFHGPNVNR